MRKTECFNSANITDVLIEQLFDDMICIADEHKDICVRFTKAEENLSGLKEYLNTLPVADLKQKRKIIELDKLRNQLKDKLLS